MLQKLVPGCDKVGVVVSSSYFVFTLSFSRNRDLYPPLILVFSRQLHVVLFSKQVTGKALMLDEIINYVQSLQNQVEVPKLTKPFSIS